MYRNFYSYNDMPQISHTEPISKEMALNKSSKPQTKEADRVKKQNNNILSSLKTDDVILIIVAFLLISNDCDDSILLLAIAFIFLSGIL